MADLQPLLYSRQLQMGEAKRAEHTRLGDAVSCGVIANETLGYFIGRTHLFMLRVGINPKRLRFRWGADACCCAAAKQAGTGGGRRRHTMHTGCCRKGVLPCPSRCMAAWGMLEECVCHRAC